MGKKKFVLAVFLILLFLGGQAFALQAPRPAFSKNYYKSGSPVISSAPSNTVVGPWQSLWQMHYKWNPVTKSWEKRVFVPSKPRGNYDFLTKKWVETK